MRHRKKLLTVLASLAALGLVTWFLTPRTPDPVCNGKRLSEWLDDYGSSAFITSIPPRLDEANAAIRVAGINAIPLLLKYTMAHDSPVKLKLVDLASRVRFLNFRYVSAQVRQREAIRAFRALGPEAAVLAVPELMRIYNQYPAQQCTVLEVLGEIGPTAKEAIPIMIGATTNGDPATRLVALLQVGRMNLEPDVIVPLFIRGLSDTNRGVQSFAVTELGELGPQAKPAIPRLLELRRAQANPPRFVAPFWMRIDAAIEKIEPSAARYDAPK